MISGDTQNAAAETLLTEIGCWLSEMHDRLSLAGADMGYSDKKNVGKIKSKGMTYRVSQYLFFRHARIAILFLDPCK